VNILSLHCHLTSPPTQLIMSCWTYFSKIRISYNTNTLMLFPRTTCSKLWHKTTASNLFLFWRHPIQRKENEGEDQRVIIIGTIKMSMISFTLLLEFSSLYPIHKPGRGPEHPLLLGSGSMMFPAIPLPPVFVSLAYNGTAFITEVSCFMFRWR